MQIDFHHAVTYIVARLAGFSPGEAEIVAHSAQYVDDATNSGTIYFTNGAQYTRIASAHRMLDYENMDQLASHHVWLPFHFLPGNLSEPASDSPVPFSGEEFRERCVCRPNSHIAREMMQDVIKRQERPYALYRLGIASHVYIDTWAHQGFVGYQDPRNRASDISSVSPEKDKSLLAKLHRMFGERMTDLKSGLVGDILPLGHGAVLSYPDQPYLVWSYTNGLGERIERDNPRDFLAAIQALYQFYRRYRDYASEGQLVLTKEYAVPAAFMRIDGCLRSFVESTGEERHTRWAEAVRQGVFEFDDFPDYVAKGEGSWKHQALGTTAADGDDEAYEFISGFLSSHWKHFHDALQIHRLHILNELLPRFGLTAA